MFIEFTVSALIYPETCPYLLLKIVCGPYPNRTYKFFPCRFVEGHVPACRRLSFVLHFIVDGMIFSWIYLFLIARLFLMLVQY